MIQCQESESDFVNMSVKTDDLNFTDIEVLGTSQINVIARGRRFGRRWFLKGLCENSRNSTAMRSRLLKEFEIHSRLSHQGVVRCQAPEEVPGLGLCIVQEWIDGLTLTEVLRQGQLSNDKRRRLMRQIIEATAYMHTLGVVHRDLKPDNIMVRSAGDSPTIVDFGHADTCDYLEIKQAGGTKGYVSPEQKQGGMARPTDDVYSLGVIMTRVCPSFRRLATRCTGNLQRRPTDAQQLLRLFERRCSLRKRIILYTVGCITAIICVIAGLSIHNIRSSASHAREEITRLTAENRQNKQQVTGLNDSLNHVNQRMGEASARLDSIKKYNALKASRLEEGKSKLLAILIRHDKPISNIDPKETQKIYDCIKQVQDEILSTIEAYHSSLSKTALTPTDRESIRDEMYNYYLLECDKYFKKWIERVKSGVIKE